MGEGKINIDKKKRGRNEGEIVNEEEKETKEDMKKKTGRKTRE